MNNLPIVARLIDRKEFSKDLNVENLNAIIYIYEPTITKLGFTLELPLTTETCVINKLEFYLEYSEIVKQKNGKEHIIATYREC